jgi:hypothetical protein
MKQMRSDYRPTFSKKAKLLRFAFSLPSLPFFSTKPLDC